MSSSLNHMITVLPLRAPRQKPWEKSAGKREETEKEHILEVAGKLTGGSTLFSRRETLTGTRAETRERTRDTDSKLRERSIRSNTRQSGEIRGQG